MDTRMPSTRILSAYIKKESINPYGKLAPTDIIKLNDRMAQLKERLFLKDKVIQDKIQLVEALNFFHQKQIDVFNQTLN